MLSHPQLPRYGELVELDGALWLVRDWQDGIAYDLLLRQGGSVRMRFCCCCARCCRCLRCGMAAGSCTVI